MPIDEKLKLEIQKTFEKQKANRIKLGATNASERKVKLKKLLNEVLASQDEICEAVYKDLRKSKEETKLTEIFTVTTELKHTIRKLGSWMRPKRILTPLAFFGASSKIYYESIGQSLIISPWNYPFQLAVGPLISAIAAGNTVIIKPSEKSPNTSGLIQKMLDKLFSEDEVKVYLGDAEVSKELTSLPFNHIFFTGSPQVGKYVMEAASKNLAKVTLELGGKSPTIVHRDVDIKASAKRIAWGKFMNAGQTCVAPDYLLVHESIKEIFTSLLIKEVKSLYGENDNLTRENNYCRLINPDHLDSVVALLEDAKLQGAKVLCGGKINRSDNFISPTVIDGVTQDSLIMKKEIFGPVLPILTYSNEEEIFEIVEKNPNPLSLYVFSRNRTFTNRILKKIPAGSAMVNDAVIHFANRNLPFGGINQSGIGNAHGLSGFKAFSNEKSVMRQSKLSAMVFLYPPYNKLKNKLIEIVVKYL